MTRSSLFQACLAICFVMLSSSAEARSLSLEPQNRVHAGLSIADFGTVGVGAGLDSRLTRLVYVDAGAYVSPLAANGDDPTTDPETNPEDWFSLRHSLYVMPGFRLPHRYKGQLTWDFFARVGFGVVWAMDHSYDDFVLINPALIGGAELLLRYDKVGVRFSGKANHFRTWAHEYGDEISMTRPQWGTELVYQW